MKTEQFHYTPFDPLNTTITVGIVVGTYDPQQMGRIKVLCRAWGDQDSTPVTDLPWALASSPFAGEVQVGTRGADGFPVDGPTAYGFWAVPKLGAEVLVLAIDGNPEYRVWFGCLHPQFYAHTMPHGRFSYNPDNAVEGESAPYGPFDTFERSIDPLYTNLQEAFGEPEVGDLNFEFQTRAADYQVAALTKQGQLRHSSVLDDSRLEVNGVEYPDGDPLIATQGYQTNRLSPGDIIVEDENTQEGQQSLNRIPNLDNMVTSLVSPGFHAFSMDDRAENCRIRLRTTAGHQIILDDTNERIYISTAKGENWIEMDQAGNIDIYTSGKMSVRANEDINFSTGGSFRVDAERGIHLNSGKQFRVQAEEDIVQQTQGLMRLFARNDIRTQTVDGDISLLSGQQVLLDSATNTSITLRDGTFNLSGTSTVEIGTTGNLLLTSQSSASLAAPSGALNLFGSTLNLNSSLPPLANVNVTNDNNKSAQVDSFPALLPNRQPSHEPWARVDRNDRGQPLLQYNSKDVGKLKYVTGEDGTTLTDPITITRGPFWRR